MLDGKLLSFGFQNTTKYYTILKKLPGASTLTSILPGKSGAYLGQFHKTFISVNYTAIGILHKALTQVMLLGV
jgi:hypothetical protein